MWCLFFCVIAAPAIFKPNLGEKPAAITQVYTVFILKIGWELYLHILHLAFRTGPQVLALVA